MLRLEASLEAEGWAGMVRIVHSNLVLIRRNLATDERSPITITREVFSGLQQQMGE